MRMYMHMGMASRFRTWVEVKFIMGQKPNMLRARMQV